MLALSLRLVLTASVLWLGFTAPVHAQVVSAWGGVGFGEANVPANLSPCIAISAGRHALALQQDGMVRAWGACQYGECTIPPDLGACTSIDAGGYRSLAIKQNGAMRTWGDFSYGTNPNLSAVGPCTAVVAGYMHFAVISRLLDPPSGVNASDGTSAYHVAVAWEPAAQTQFVQGYRVFRGSSEGDLVQIGVTTGAASTTYYDTIVPPGVTLNCVT